MKTLPVDRNRTFHEYDFPSNPSLYTPLRHFAQRAKEDERFLSDEVIRAAIEEGDLRDNGDGCGCFRLEWGEGVAYYIIVGWHYDGYRVVITGWPHLHHRESALASGEWSSEELDVIEALNERHQERFEDKYPVYNGWLESKGVKS